MGMVDIRVLLPVLSILSMGSFLATIFKRKLLRIKEKDSILEHLLESLVLGTISLIVPMLILALAANKYDNSSILEKFVYIYAAISLIYLAYKIYSIVRSKLPAFVLSEKKSIPPSLEFLLIIIIFLAFFFYILQGLVYPLRGWDFLHFYLPNSFRIYVTGQLGRINELNFLPQFKPPANILLYAFGFFITQAEMIQLIPLLFLGGSAYLCYKIAILENLSKKTALIATIAFLATPLTYFLIYEFQYYQEIFILFFTSASFYYFRKLIKTPDTRNKLFVAVFTSLSLVGCVLSKISGFILPFVILVAVPSDKMGKILRSLIIVGFSIQLVRKSVFEIYLGTGIFISLLAIYCIYLVFSSETLSFSYSRWLYVLGVYFLPLVIAAFWIKHILSIQGVRDYLASLYVNVRHDQLSLNWAGIALPASETYLENGHTATFISSSFVLLIGVMFTGTWLFFKIFGFLDANKKNKELILWLIFFYFIWQGFFAEGSIRYLSPILIPISITFAIGVEKSLTFLNKRDNEDRDGFLGTLFIIASSYLFLYPVIPFETIKEEFHLRWYHAHTHLGSLLGYTVLFNILTLILFWKEKKLKLGYNQVYTKKFNFRKVISGFLIFIVFFVPFMAQTALLFYVKFDFNTFKSEYCYDTRTSYQELIEAINRLGYSDDLTVLSINTPGLEYYTSQPVIDLFMLGFIETSGLANSTFPLAISNVTRTLEFFEEYNVAIFVSLNNTHVWYQAFRERYYWNFFIYRFLHNNQYFTFRFSNNEFMLFTIEKYDSFIGPVDIQLTNTTHKESMLALNPNSLTIQNAALLDAILDFTSIPTNDLINVTVSTEYSTYYNDTPIINTSFYQFQRRVIQQFDKVTLLELGEETTLIHNVKIDISYRDFEGFVVEKSYSLSPYLGTSVNITRTGDKWFYSGYFGFVYS